MVDILGYRLKIAIVADAANTVVSPDLVQMAVTGVSTHVSDVRVTGPDDRGEAVGDAIARASAKLPKAISLCLDGEAGLPPGGAVPIIPAWDGLAAAIQTGLYEGKAGLLTPWSASRVDEIVSRLECLGVQIARHVQVEAERPELLAHSRFTDLRAHVAQALAGDARTLIQLGHNMPLLRLAQNIEEDTGAGVIAINAASHWHMLRELGVSDAVPGLGRLFMHA